MILNQKGTEREGFEPSVHLRRRLISNQVNSATHYNPPNPSLQQTCASPEGTKNKSKSAAPCRMLKFCIGSKNGIVPKKCGVERENYSMFDFDRMQLLEIMDLYMINGTEGFYNHPSLGNQPLINSADGKAPIIIESYLILRMFGLQGFKLFQVVL